MKRPERATPGRYVTVIVVYKDSIRSDVQAQVTTLRYDDDVNDRTAEADALDLFDRENNHDDAGAVALAAHVSHSWEIGR